MNKVRAAITGVATCVPDDVLTNQDLEKMVDTNDEWILSRTGIETRHILKGEGKGVSYMAEKAVKELLEKTNTDPKEIELVIFATVTPDHIFPATANKISYNLGMSNAWGFDLEAACSGFLYSLTLASKMIETGTHKKVLVVGADKMSAIIDYQDRATCIIFGDGGGAVLLEPDEENGIIDSVLGADGIGVQFLHMKAGGSIKPPSIESVQAREHYVYQEGKTVFKFAVTNMADSCEKIMQRNNLGANDISYLLAHQANKRIIDATANRMGLDQNKVLYNIQRYGNTTNGTIPLLMGDFESKFKKGDNLILAAFGGGFTWGATYLKWAI
ncbi:MAG: ketoacyl-ACP synthase III [Bacteroidetes bacterium]|nr:ketoacyl-ACP synthase III [Bacteroidota bacterium]